MLIQFTIDHNGKMPIYKQIAISISKQIDKSILQKGSPLPSINIFSEQFAVARDTVERAYKELRKEGYISSVKGKGYFVNSKKEHRLRILLVLNKLSSFKKIVYYSFLETLGDKAMVDLQIHHYNPLLFKEIIENNLGKYDYYVIMPHFEVDATKEAYMDVIKLIPENELLLLDKVIPELNEVMAVAQDFKRDVYDALISLKESFEKYKEIILVFPELIHHPLEIIEGVKSFSKKYNKSFTVIPNAVQAKLLKGQAYVVIEEDDLVVLIKKMRATNFKIGETIGIVSFNETPLKDLLDITVMSTDFEQMGKTAAEFILNNEYKQVRNPFKIIKRLSL